MPPQNPDPENKNNIDLGKILLPKKETGPSPDSAQRINAGELLAQEEAAALPKPASSAPVAPPAPIAPAPAPAASPVSQPAPSPQTPIAPQPGAPAPHVIPSAPTAPPLPKKPEESSIKAVVTYTSDISRVVKEGNISSVSIAAAEAERRANATSQEAVAPQNFAAEERRSPMKWVLITAGVFLILGAFATLAIFLIKPSSPTQVGNQEISSPFMSVDQVTPVSEGSPPSRDTLLTNLAAARDQVNISLGLVAWLVPTTAATSSGSITPIPAQTFFSTIAPNIPEDLLRSIEPDYLLGVHSYDENQPFLIFRVDSYQQGYAGMLQWEETMQQELTPLFTRHPSPHIIGIDEASTTGSSTPQFIQTGFVDQVVENHDSRVLLNATNDILLLWTFLDRNTVLITTNDATLREVTRRLTTSSVVPQPQ